MQLIFAHGWGFGPDIWREVVEKLDVEMPVSCLDFGFVSLPETVRHDFNQKGIAILSPSALFNSCSHSSQSYITIGHSLGVLWLLKHWHDKCRGFVSICGFDCFVPYIHPRVLMAMRRGLKKDPQRQLEQFWTTCAVDAQKFTYTPNVDSLDRGLFWLQDWNAQEQKLSLNCPKLVLAAQNDQIVAKDMTEMIWGVEGVIWHQTAGHVLPLTAPDWLTLHIRLFLHKLNRQTQ